VIVVVGSPAGRIVEGRITLAGMAGETARAAAATGAEVQLVGRVGGDPAADALLLALAAAGVGHVAVLRDPARPTPVEGEAVGDGSDDIDPVDTGAEPTAPQNPPIELDAGDVDLGLRYLTEFAVLVVAPPATADVLRMAVDGARWASAGLILVVDAEAPPDLALPPDAIVLEAPEDDPDGAFATVVGRLAAALDGGAAADAAFAQVVESAGWTVASGS
jgi:sugar/nucleoside kinase (ribokinase family)